MFSSIGVLYTGGTIGMLPSRQGLAPAPLSAEAIGAAMGGEIAPFTLRALEEPIDSAEATPEDWLRIADAARDLAEDHDAVIVLHGTDTMAFSASAVSFLMRDLAKPVVFTGSQLPLSQESSDAPANLRLAFAAAHGPCREVMIAFGGVVLRGNCAKKLDAHDFQGFDSPNFPPLAMVKDGDLIWNELERLPLLSRFSPELGAEVVASVRLAPGFSIKAFEAVIESGPRALVLELYGIGTGPGGNAAFIEGLKRAKAKGIVAVGVSQCPVGAVDIGTYAAGSALAEAGVIGLGRMTFEAAYTKLHVLAGMGLSAGEMRRLILSNWRGEI